MLKLFKISLFFYVTFLTNLFTQKFNGGLMLKRSYMIIVTVLLAFVWSSSVLAQESPFKDNYEGQYIKQEVPLGQNVPLQYEGPLVVLYDNGPLVTHPGGGSGGADASALQTALGMGTYGYGHQISAGNSIADDFTISGASWNIDELRFFAYQTGSSTTSTINDIRVQVYDGDPSAGGTIIYGDLTTNVLATTTWTNIYRVLDTDLLASNRPIMENVVQLTPPLNLGAGTYWIEWQCGGTLTSGPWAPPVTVLGSTGTGNALQNTGTWAAVTDVGPQDFPFLVLGNSGPPCPVDPPTNPNPPDGTVGVPVSGNTATWDNGSGTTAVELYFGEVGSLVQVYDGTPITSFSLAPVEPLNYSTTYGWRVVCKNDTCGVSGPVWTFTTADPPGVVFYEPFPDLANWTVAGPLGLTNWSAAGSNNALGASGAPELQLSWTPSFNGLSVIQTTVPIPVDITHNHTIKFDHFVDWFADPSGPMGFGVSTDGGATWITIWEITPTGNVGPEQLSFSGIMPPASPITLLFYYNGDSFNIDFWYVDDLWLIDDDFIPVELTTFTATANNGTVELSWITATETNNSGFEIERSSGGEFENIGFVSGYGTTTASQYYSYIDKDVPVGTYSYRLKQVDLDGTYEYSEVIEVDVPAPISFALGQNYPNPFNPSTKVEFSLAADAKVNLKVFDLLGQEVMTVVNSNLVAGIHTVDIDATLLNSGVYFYKLEADGVNGTNFVDVKKMILTK
jgi:hypothetical protein